MAFNYNRAHEISTNGLAIENGVHIISGIDSPQGAISPNVFTLYIQTNGDIWSHNGSGGANFWIKTSISQVPSLSQAPVFDVNGTLTSVTYYSSPTQIVGNRIAKIDLTYNISLDPITEVETYYSTIDGTTVIKTVTRTYNFTSNILTNVTQVTS